MSALSRFFGEGFRDAERRIAALTSPQPIDEPRVVALFESSAVFGVITSAVDHVVRAYETSALTTTAAGVIRNWWTERSWQWRRFTAGVVLVVAAATHAGLYLMQQSPTGWLWLVVPGMTFVVGGLSVAASGAGARRTGR